MKPAIPDWNMIDESGVPKLDRDFKFNNFEDALSFTNGIGAIAESEGHHPRITTEWGKVGITWWTHKIRNLHQNDFIMAAKTDELYNTIVTNHQ
jgi:4a-hydroxytetrahydrobiopterin dehydratase|tara:strand:+ start:622 stop:903 length:282 start_codon:yes stop_codon:yes gene_type:complete